MAEEKLIELVRERPLLYDKKHPGYKDARGRCFNNWKDIAEAMRGHGFHAYEGQAMYLYCLINNNNR